jgi:hypothetical protein
MLKDVKLILQLLQYSACGGHVIFKVFQSVEGQLSAPVHCKATARQIEAL